MDIESYEILWPLVLLYREVSEEKQRGDESTSQVNYYVAALASTKPREDAEHLVSLGLITINRPPCLLIFAFAS